MTRSTSSLFSPFFQEKTAARTQTLVALLLTALSVLLHAQFLWHHAALWRDEVNSVGLATMPTLRQLWASLSYDSSPILWPLLLRIWIFGGAGSSDFSLRLFGFLMQMLLLGGLWFCSLSMTKRAPILSLLLVGFAPAIVVWPSLRSYGLGAALVLWAMGCLWQALENPTPTRQIIAFLLGLLSVQCLYANLIFLGAICGGGVIVGLYKKQPRLVLFSCAVLLTAALSLLIYIPTFMRIAPWQRITLEKITPELVVARAYLFMHWSWIGLAVLSLLTVPFPIINAFKKLPLKPNQKYLLAFSFTISLISFFAMVLFLKKAGRLPYAWHFVGLIVLLGSCVDAVYYVFLKDIKTRIYFPIVVLALSFPLFFAAQKDVAERRTNIDSVAVYLNNHAGPQDLVVLTPFYIGATYLRYSAGKTPWVTVPDIKHYEIQRYDIVRDLMDTSDSLRPVESRILATLQSGHRVWFVGSLPEAPKEAPRYVLPDAYGPNGWFYTRYMAYCSAQISYFMSQHGARRSFVPVPQLSKVRPLESVRVEVVEGLKTPPAP